MLCESRVLLGRELEDVASELRIRLGYLHAIEDGRLDDLPGTTYATGFLRTYADFLGLDGEDLVRQFKAAGMAAPQAPDLHLPSPVEDGRLPTSLVLLVAVLLAVGAYGGWYYMSSQDRDPTDNVAALPERLAEFVGIEIEKDQNSDAKGTNSQITPPTASTNETANNIDMSDIGNAVEPMVKSDLTNGDAAPASTLPPERTAEVETNQIDLTIGATQVAPPPAPRKSTVTPDLPLSTEAIKSLLEPPPMPKRKPTTIHASEPKTLTGAALASEKTVAEVSTAESAQFVTPAVVSPTTHRVVLRAIIDTWVQVVANDEEPLLSRLMREVETFVVPARPGLIMATGNSGGVEILIDGKAIPRLGSVGEIRTNINLDIKSLLGTSTALP